MAAKKPPPSGGPSKLYLLSFGDCMTSLLAFFIILTSLAQDQTGVDLYVGTGSFVQALDSYGLPGVFPRDRSKLDHQADTCTPQYAVGGDDVKKPNDEQSESDPNKPPRRVLDRELESFERMIFELERRYDVNALPKMQGRVEFDVFEPLNSKSPRLPQGARQILAQVVPLLKIGLHEVEIIVWATTPRRTAWQRAVRESALLRGEAIAMAQLPDAEQHRLKASGRAWPVPDARRPVMTVVVTRIDTTRP
jgi:hypothetical protein